MSFARYVTLQVAVLVAGLALVVGLTVAHVSIVAVLVVVLVAAAVEGVVAYRWLKARERA